MAVELQKHIQEMKTNQQPSMPPEVLQQRQQLETQGITQLREADNICAQEMEAVAPTWEQIVDDETAEQLSK